MSNKIPIPIHNDNSQSQRINREKKKYVYIIIYAKFVINFTKRYNTFDMKLQELEEEKIKTHLTAINE